MKEIYPSTEVGLSAAAQRSVEAYAQQRFGMSVEWLDETGAQLRPDSLMANPLRLAPARAAVSDAVRDASRWGEPAIFFLCPGLVNWVIPLCHGELFAGGLLSGGVLLDPVDRADVGAELRGWGMDADAAVDFSAHLPVWSEERLRRASVELFDAFYRESGWSPERLLRSQEIAAQQRAIAQEIHTRKLSSHHPYPIDEERKLLAMIRVGDGPGAKGVLNQLLAGLFLHAPGLSALKLRAVEFMGYLVRVTSEENPLLEPLITSHRSWSERLIDAADFEEVCIALRDALDAYIREVDGGSPATNNRSLRLAMLYLEDHSTESITLADVAAAASLSPGRLAHLMKECTGKTVMQHLRHLRVTRAQELLENTTLSGADIAARLGFHDQSHFIREFRTATGTTPLKYRERTAPITRLPAGRR